MPDAEPERKRPRRQFDESRDPSTSEEKHRSTPLIAGLVLLGGLAISLPMLSAKPPAPSPAASVAIAVPVPMPTPVRRVQAVEEPAPAPAPLPRIIAGNSVLEPLREAEPLYSKDCNGCDASQAPGSYASRRYAQPPPVMNARDYSGLGGVPAAPLAVPAVPPGVVRLRQPAQFSEMCDRLYLYKVANNTSKDWTNLTVRADSGESWTAARLAPGQTMDVKTSQPTGAFDISGSQAP